MQFIKRLFRKRLPSLLVIGGGGHGRVVLEAAWLSGKFDQLVAVDPMMSPNWPYAEHLCVASEADVSAEPGKWRFIVAIGSPVLRRQLFGVFVGKGFDPVSVFHPAANISPSARLGRGCTVLAGGVIGAGAVIGNGAIVNNGAIVEHDCLVEAFAHLAPGAVLAGGAVLGSESFLGANSSVKQGISIAGGVTVGNGAAIVRDITVPGVYVGNPARLLKGVKKTAE